MTERWICHRCYTSNPSEAQTCASCGQPRSTAPMPTAAEPAEAPTEPPSPAQATPAPLPERAPSWASVSQGPVSPGPAGPEPVGPALRRFSGARLWLGVGIGIAAVALIAFGFATAAHREDGGAITQSGSMHWTELRIGDCFSFTDKSEDVDTVTAAPCSESHVYEVFYVGQLAGGEYPSVDVLDADVNERCTPAFEAYVEHDYQTSVWYGSYVAPAEDAWNDGEHTLVCHLFNSTETAVTGSARGSAR